MVQSDWWSSSHHNISNFLEIKIEEKRGKFILASWSLLRLLFILSKISIQLLLSSHWKELSQTLLHIEEKKYNISDVQLHFVHMQWKCGFGWEIRRLPQHATLLLIYHSTKSIISLFYMENVCTKVLKYRHFFSLLQESLYLVIISTRDSSKILISRLAINQKSAESFKTFETKWFVQIFNPLLRCKAFPKTFANYCGFHSPDYVSF